METFVIQIRTQPQDEAEPSARELHGLVEHVGSGRRQPFADTRELLAFLRAEYRNQPKEAER
jgi:hypothetical protein